LFNMFDIICNDDVNNGKPESDIFIKACEILENSPPKECLHIEVDDVVLSPLGFKPEKFKLPPFDTNLAWLII
ncbi:15089_t:CDS:2, partial [Dentiscutata heterogama]